MKLYKGVCAVGLYPKKAEFIADNTDVDSAFAIIVKREQQHYIRINGPFPDGSYYFDYGSWSTFYVLTDEELSNEDTQVSEN